MNNRGLYVLITALICTVALSSCSVTRHIPTGSYLLKANVVEIDKNTPRNERITAPQIEKYIRQTPNKRFLGTNMYIWIYSMSNPSKDNWINRLLRRVGQAPVLLDTNMVNGSTSNIKSYMNSCGFINSKETYAIDSARKRATVIYKTVQGKPYRIGKISYDYKDKFIESVIQQDSSSTLLHTGSVFDTGVLNKERLRIADYLKDQGYYNFSINNISYVADSTAGNYTINLTMVVKQYLSSYNDNGNPIYVNNSIFRLKDIYIHPNYNPTTATNDPKYQSRLDTTEYLGLNIVYDTKLYVRENVLRQMINLYPNHLYSAKDVQRAYNNIMRMGYYNSASILFTEDTTQVNNYITYIGSDSQTDNAENTTEKYLSCTILCTPALRQSYKIDLEASSTSSFYALTATVGYQNRNLFKGMELFDISLKGGYEFMRVKNNKGSFELGGAISVSFPRFIMPFSSRFRRVSNPKTKFELSINAQQRPYYHRTLSSATWGYSWNRGKFSTLTLRPIDLSLVKLSYIDKENFLDKLENPYLKNSYQDQLIAGISGSYIYNNQLRDIQSNALVVRLNWETAGNLVGGLTHLLSRPVKGKDYYNLLGITYAQYVRAEASVSNKIVIGNKSSIVYRVLGGAGLSYGNSQSIPFDRLFYCGGSNGMRGWIARTLGPGSEPKSNLAYPSQLGNLKLEANLEGRFPVWGILHGALFFDVGNIWFIKAGDAQKDGVFRFNTFFPQLGFNTGIGARVDLGFFVLRLDWGIKLYDPNEPIGSRWIHNFKIKNTALNFGVGYPF